MSGSNSGLVKCSSARSCGDWEFCGLNAMALFRVGDIRCPIQIIILYHSFMKL